MDLQKIRARMRFWAVVVLVGLLSLCMFAAGYHAGLAACPPCKVPACPQAPAPPLTYAER